MSSSTTQTVNMLSSAFYLLTLIGGVNWLVTGMRLAYPETESGSGVNTTLTIPDALSWGGESFQMVVYFLVGLSSVSLLLLTFSGFWVRRGDALISCERVSV